MFMPLIAGEDGVPHFVKQPGVTLSPGDILGILTLDDPTRVKHAKPFEGQLPSMGAPAIASSKPHQRLHSNIDTLNNMLDGFDNMAMTTTLKDLIEVLHDPELPFSEVTAVLSALAGRMAAKLEESVRSAIDKTKSTNPREFPSARLTKIIENHLTETIRPQDRTMVRAQLAPLIDVVEKFKGGLKGHEWGTIAALLRRYESTEKLFGGSIEERVLKLRDENKENLRVVAGLVLSHSKAQSKNKLVMAILEHVKNNGSILSSEDSLSAVLKDLALLESK